MDRPRTERCKMESTERTRILVVDDEESICRMCVALLSKGGYDVTAASDAFGAMREVRDNHYDIVLSDIRMPGVSGETLIERVRQVRPDAMPIIMTGFPTLELAASAPAKGVYAFLTKPFQADDLLQTIQQVVDRRDEELDRARDHFTTALLETEKQLGDAFDLPNAIDSVLGTSLASRSPDQHEAPTATSPPEPEAEIPTAPSDAAPRALHPTPPPASAPVADPAPEPAPKPVPTKTPATTAAPRTTRRVGDLADVSSPLSADVPPAATVPAFDTSQPLLVVLCEPIPKDQAILKKAPAYRHFRTIYAAHRVLSEKLRESQSSVQIELVMASHNTDIPSYFRRHARRICCVIFGPNMTRLTQGGLRLAASGGRRRQVVVCYSQEKMDFGWEHLRELGRNLDVWGCGADAPVEVVREFWSRFFSEELMRVVQGEAVFSEQGLACDAGPLSREAIQESLARDEQAVELLPGFPHICRRAIDAIDHGKRYAEVADIIEPDGSLQASMIRCANVARYGSMERIRTLPNALSRLGMEEARKIIMGETMQQLMKQVGQAGFDTRSFFHHSACAGFYAQILSLNLDSPSQSERSALQSLDLPLYAKRALNSHKLWQRFHLHDAFDPFSAGILHDIGKLLTVICFADAFPLVLHEYEKFSWQGSLLDAEQGVVGDFQHPVAGGALLDRWGLFARLVDPIRDHHSINENSSSGAVLIALANCLTKATYPFPMAITIADAFRKDHLKPVVSPAGLVNPLPEAFGRIERPFRQATQKSLTSETEDEPMSSEDIEAILHAAEEAASRSALEKAYTDTLLGQNPELSAVLAWLETTSRDLLALQLVLHPFVSQRVDTLCGPA
jgi:CheY-like chemotaxis protein/HD-like signal output (HDOD) protein